jgi:hypothetical protein
LQKENYATTGYFSENGTNATHPKNWYNWMVMNKKKKQPEFINPFKDTQEEKDRKMVDFVMAQYVSDKGSKIKLTQTVFTGGYRKFVLEETVYIKNTEVDKKLSDILDLKPQDQIRREKYLVFDAIIDDTGKMKIVRKDNPSEFAEFNKKESKMIMHFYRLNTVVLENAPKDLDFIYKNKESVRQAKIDINRKFIYAFPTLISEEENYLITGETRHDYWFNPYVRLNIIDKS